MNKAAAAMMLAAAVLWAQGPEVPLDPGSSFQVKLPADAPVALAGANWDQSKATARGGALQVDLHSTLQLKNVSQRRIRGVSLLVMAQEVTPGGKGSVTVPSLDVAPGETFAVRVDLRLMRPLARGGGALVEVGLDGVLYDDLTFYGPDRLNSRRAMTAWELEARRDRRQLLAALERGGAEQLGKEMVAAVARQGEQPRLEMQVARMGRATNIEPGREVAFAFLQLPDAPVELLQGSAMVQGNEARAPRIEVVNRSRRPVRYLEIGWVVKDAEGRSFVAGAAPSELELAPGARGVVAKDNALRFTRPGQGPVPIAGLSGFVNAVEFADGGVWVPARESPVMSGEMQRLAELYKRRGLDVVVEQLRKLR
jgi:hypothetical protein